MVEINSRDGIPTNRVTLTSKNWRPDRPIRIDVVIPEQAIIAVEEHLILTITIQINSRDRIPTGRATGASQNRGTKIRIRVESLVRPGLRRIEIQGGRCSQDPGAQ